MSLADRDTDDHDSEGHLPEESELGAGSPEQGRGLRALLLTVAYDGSNYFGWQRQPEHPTVQAELERALAEVTGESSIRALASSRTDTGVHAIGQSVLCRTSNWKASADKFPFALNTKLPLDIVVRDAREVPIDFFPLRHSTGKRYRYLVYCSRKGDPINARTHWWVRRRMSLERMQAAAKLLVGEHDFVSFQSTGSPRSSTIRNVKELTISRNDHMDGQLYSFEIEANGFLYNMVRNIVGTLVQVGVGREEPEWINHVLRAGNRCIAGATAPPQGLCLMQVFY